MKLKLGTAARRIVSAVLIVLVLAGCGFAWYISDYYRAGETAAAAATDENGAADGIAVRHLPGGVLAGDALAFEPIDPVAGLVFYPGAKVQSEAYAPLLTACAENGILCVLVAPPLNLALTDTNAAESLQAQYPNIDTWIIAGHSMGGVAASSYVASHSSKADALVLLASYPADDLTAYEGKVLSIRGSEDGVLNLKNYEEAWSKLPSSATELIVEGGNHAQYGDYGPQAGDNEATISAAQQQTQTANAIVALL